MDFDHAKHLKIATDLAKSISKAIAPHIGKYDDKVHVRGFTGDTTYEIDEPVEKAVIDFFTELDLPLTVFTEDAGKVTFGKGTPQAIYLIDPLDGSRNARRHLPFFCTSIAIFPPDALTLDEVAVSLINRLDADETFHGITGDGAYLNGKKITPSQKTELTDAIIGLGAHFTETYPLYDEFCGEIFKLTGGGPNDVMIKCLGSTALELAYLAAGRIDMIADIRSLKGIEASPKTYDIAAGIHLLSLAGGKSEYGTNKLFEKVSIDPSIPVSVIAAGNERLFTYLSNILK